MTHLDRLRAAVIEAARATAREAGVTQGLFDALAAVRAAAVIAEPPANA